MTESAAEATVITAGMELTVAIAALHRGGYGLYKDDDGIWWAIGPISGKHRRVDGWYCPVVY